MLSWVVCFAVQAKSLACGVDEVNILKFKWVHNILSGCIVVEMTLAHMHKQIHVVLAVY